MPGLLFRCSAIGRRRKPEEDTMKTCGNCANRNRNECCTAVPMCVLDYLAVGNDDQDFPTDDDDDASDCACWAPKERPADR